MIEIQKEFDFEISEIYLSLKMTAKPEFLKLQI